ncbi:MAG: BACON domain-containing protein [Bacteroidales bacterium]|nr:BACON domain-containing protein [Bacteroidales bacterium]MBR0299790.1 BACON domain-containing protein [Bacteroidales bacterium]
MKKHLPLLLLIPFLIVSCETYRTLEVNKDSIEFQADENTMALRIKTTGPWSIRPATPPDTHPFYEITPDSGRGDAEVLIRVEHNYGKTHRSQELTVVGEDESKTVTLIQKGVDPYVESECIIAEPDAMGRIPASGGVVRIGGAHTGDLVIRCDTEGVSFDRTSFPHSAYKGVFVFQATVPACPNAEGRTVTFCLTTATESGEAAFSCSAKQSGTN